MREDAARDAGPRVAEAAAALRQEPVYLPTLVPLVYSCNGTSTRETKQASERASMRRKVLRRAREQDERSLSRMWMYNGMCSGRGRDRVAGTAVRPRGPSTPHGGRTRERALMGNGTGDVYYMILIHIYPYVALNAACEMSRAETGERDREEN